MSLAQRQPFDYPRRANVPSQRATVLLPHTPPAERKTIGKIAPQHNLLPTEGFGGVCFIRDEAGLRVPNSLMVPCSLGLWWTSSWHRFPGCHC